MNYIYQYSDYRDYLKDYFEFKKKHSQSFSLEQFSRKTKYISRPLLSLILKKKRKLSSKNLVHLMHALELNAAEAQYFRNLVHFNQSDNTREKEYYLSLLINKMEKSKSNFPLGSNKIFIKWFSVALLELSRLKDFNSDPLWIKKRLKREISVSDIKKTLLQLEKNKFLTRDKEGELKSSKAKHQSTMDIKDLHLQKYHQESLELAKASLSYDPIEEREIGTLCLPVDSESFDSIKQRIQNFYHEIIQDYKPQTKENIAQLNIQLFKITKTNELEKKNEHQ